MHRDRTKSPAWLSMIAYYRRPGYLVIGFAWSRRSLVFGRHAMTGLYFEEFKVGMIFDHPLHRTITEADNVLFSTMTHNPSPLHLVCRLLLEKTKKHNS